MEAMIAAMTSGSGRAEKSGIDGRVTRDLDHRDDCVQNMYDPAGLAGVSETDINVCHDMGLGYSRQQVCAVDAEGAVAIGRLVRKRQLTDGEFRYL
jgi:hypothetical protein